MKLLIRSLLATLVFLGAYQVWLRVLPAAVAVPQGLNQQTIIKLQDYLYAQAGRYPTVILGSSLAAKLRTQALPPGVCNLAMRGQSVFKGFELLRRAKQAPALILVETNMLDWPPTYGDIDLTSNLFHPALHPLRRWYSGLQARHQPVNEALANGLASLARLRPAAAAHIEDRLGVSRQAASGLAMPPEDADYQEPSPELLAVTYAEDNQVPQPLAFARNLGLLRTYVQYFRARGSRIVFFEMPMNTVCCQGAKMHYLRQQLGAAFPAGQLPYLPQPDCGAYRTLDGEHLTDPSAWRYSAALAQEMRALPAGLLPAVARLR